MAHQSGIYDKGSMPKKVLNTEQAKTTFLLNNFYKKENRKLQ